MGEVIRCLGRAEAGRIFVFDPRQETGERKGAEEKCRANLRTFFSCLLIYQSHTAITKKAFLPRLGQNRNENKERQRLQQEPASPGPRHIPRTFPAPLVGQVPPACGEAGHQTALPSGGHSPLAKSVHQYQYYSALTVFRLWCPTRIQQVESGERKLDQMRLWW